MPQIKTLTPELIAASTRGFKALYLKAFAARAETALGRLVQRFDGAGQYENYTALGAVAGMREWTGSRQFTERREDGLVVPSVEFDLAYAVPLMDLQRDQTGRHTSWFQRAGERAASYLYPRVRRVLANGTDASIAKCWDGKPLFSTIHGVGKGKNQSNIITGAGADTLAHVQTDLGKAVSAGAMFKDDQGYYVEPIEYDTVIYPAANDTLGTIFDIIAQGRIALDQPDRSARVKNVIPMPELSGNTWYLAAGGGSEKPFGIQEEMAPTLEQEVDFETRKQMWGVHASGEAFALDWMTILQVANS